MDGRNELDYIKAKQPGFLRPLVQRKRLPENPILGASGEAFRLLSRKTLDIKRINQGSTRVTFQYGDPKDAGSAS
jgi:hypothetical protein